ncbi:MAG TPA: cupin domain-containing protein [Armatimonadota bacterium]|nr:cupin domain-containing protein [Armatimonadota bacterium]HQK93899.1 cupin domain-containing protein [Armatimonadota bacterium]
MRTVHYTSVASESVGPEASGVSVRWVISDADGAPGFALRVFEIEPGGYTPRHQHPWEHEVFVLAGEGCVRSASGETRLSEGTAVLVEPDELHQFANPGGVPFRFICVVPNAAYGHGR